MAYQQVGCDPNPKVDEGTRPEQQECRLVIGPHREQEHERPHACVKRACRRDHSAGPQNWLLGLRPGGLARTLIRPSPKLPARSEPAARPVAEDEKVAAFRGLPANRYRRDLAGRPVAGRGLVGGGWLPPRRSS